MKEVDCQHYLVILFMSTPRTDQDGTPLRVLLIIVTLVLLAPLVMMVFMMPMMGLMGWWTGGVPNTGAGMSPLWGVGMMLLFLLALLGSGYLIYRAFTRGSLSSNDPALEELRLAYAQGELSQEEFEQRREELRQSK